MPVGNCLGAALRTAGKPGILYYAFGVRFTFTSRESGDITFGTCERFAVFFLLVIGNESHMKQFFIR